MPMRWRFWLVSTLICFLAGMEALESPGKEFLTSKEIEEVQDAREIDTRVKIYMNAALLRLKSAEDRLVGKESSPGDPLEFFMPEDMLDGYYRILKSVMINIDDASQNPGTHPGAIQKALKHLKSSTEAAAEELQILKKLAEEKRKEELWNLINNAIEITEGAHEGAEYGLSKESGSSKKDGKKKP
jgi:hypothetical protein